MSGRGELIRAAVLTAWLGVCLSACATAGAKPATDTPPLNIPPPPTRVIESADTEPAMPAMLPDEPSRRAPAPPLRRPPAAPPRPEPKEAPKTEPAATPPPEAPKPAAELPKPPTALQTTSADAEGKEDQQIRALLAKAAGDLNQIDYQRLNSDGRTQYDTAKRFVTQAEKALTAKNLVFARTVADKAAALAAQLAGR